MPSEPRAVIALVVCVAEGVSVRSRSTKVMEPVSMSEELSLMSPVVSMALSRISSLVF